jgi:hypothetical protein
MKNFFLGNPQGMTMNQIIELGNNEHFSKLTCSIIPTIDYWKNLDNRILTEFMLDNCEICFEYPVASIKNGTSSYTDVMLISSHTVVAIESKWKEKIGNYCKDHKAKRKDEVQKHWISIISNYLNKELAIEKFKDIEYQLLHRVASACSLGKQNCKVVYQIFYVNALNEEFIDEIKKMKDLLADPKIEFYVDAVQIEFKDRYKKLKDEIKALDKVERIKKIKQTIKVKSLFKFCQEDINQVV